MGSTTMDKVLVPAVLENVDDVFAARKGLMPVDQVRRVEVEDALIETGATRLMLPSRLVAALGLEPLCVRPAGRSPARPRSRCTGPSG